MKDLIIVGASAAGVSAAIYAARRQLDFSIVASEFGGEVALSGEIENYPGFPKTDGIELSGKFKEHLKSYDVEPEIDVWVERVERSEGRFNLIGKNDKGDWKDSAMAVLVATGQHARTLNVPGEKEYKNLGVSYCTVCDGPLFNGKDVVIIGGGNTANEAGIMMNDIASSVTVLTKNADMTGDTVLIKKLHKGDKTIVIGNAMTTEILGDGKLVTGVKYKDEESGKEKELEAEGVFVHIGAIPNSDLVKDLVEIDKIGQIKIDRLGRTNVEGLFAAGDVTDIPYKQIVVSAGDGASALLSVVDYLNKLEL